MPEVISVGPLALPPYLLVAAAVIVAAGLAIRFSTSGDLRQRVDSRFTSALLLFVVVWKLAPAVRLFEHVVRDPVALLRIPAGPAGTLVALAVALGYLCWPAIRRDTDARRPLGTAILFAAIAAVLTSQIISLVSDGPADVNADLIELLAGAAVGPGEAPARPSDMETHVDADADAQATVITAWATWCGPCRADLAVKRSAMAAHTDVVWLGVNLTSTEASVASVEDYIALHDVPYANVYDRTGTLANRLAIRGTPTTIVLDRSGQMIARWVGVSSLARLEGALPETQ